MTSPADESFVTDPYPYEKASYTRKTGTAAPAGITPEFSTVLRGFYPFCGSFIMEYVFYGHENADVEAAGGEFPGIRTPLDLYDALSEIWCAQTCAPRMREEWSPENRTLGQCSITAFLVQDIFGGRVYGILRPGGNYHCYNDVDGHVFDLTSEQFGDEKLCYENNPEQFREVHFAKEEKRLRYELLRKLLLQAAGTDAMPGAAERAERDSERGAEMRKEEKEIGAAEKITLEDLEQVSGGSEVSFGQWPDQDPAAGEAMRKTGADPSAAGRDGMSVEGVLDRIALGADQVRIRITKATTGVD